MARRSIGEVEATLSADTRKFVSEVKRVTDEAENEEVDINVGAEVDQADVQEAIRQVERAAERAEAAINVGAEANRFDIDNTIARIVADIENEEADIGIGAEKDRGDVLAAIDDVLSDIEGADGEVGVGAKVDRRDVEAAIDAVRADIEDERPDVLIGGEKDHASVEAALANVLSEIEAKNYKVNIGGEKDHFDVEAALARVEGEVAATDADVEIGGDVDTTDVSWTRTRSALRTEGQKGGAAYRGGFMDDIGDDSFWIGIALTIAQPLAEGLEGVLGAGLAVVSSGVQAVGGAAGAAAPLIAGAAVALGATALGLSGVGDALGDVQAEDWEALNSSLRDLAPNAREFVLAFASLKPTFDEVKRITQEALFEGLAEELLILSDETIPDVGDAFVIAAGSVNEFIRELSAVARETEFKETMEAIDPALDNAFDAAVLLAGTLEPFLMAAAPAAEELTGWLEDGAAALKDWVIEHPEEIQTFLSDGVASLKTWVSLAGEIIDLLATIFASGGDEGDTIVERLAHVVERWDAILESPAGQRTLDDFFGDAEQTLRDMDPFWQGIQEAVGILTGGDGEKFADLMSQLGEAAPAFAELLVALGEMELGSALANVIDTLGVFAEIFQGLPDSLQTFIGQVIVTTKVLGPLNSALKAIGVSTPWLAALNVAISAGIAIFDAWGQKEDLAAERTATFGRELDFAIDQMVEAQSAASSTSAAMEAFDTAFAEATEGSEATTQAMLTLGITNDELGQSMLNISDKSLPAATKELARMAMGMIDNEEAAAGLAEIVNSTDENFTGLAGKVEEAANNLHDWIPAGEEAADTWEGLAEQTGLSIDSILVNGLGMKNELAQQFADIAESTGLPLDRLLAIAGGMEEMQDQAESVDFEAVAREQLNFAATTDETTKALVEQAAENLHMSGSLDTILSKQENLLPLFQEYIRLLYESGGATEEGTDAMAVLSQAYTDAELATQARAEQLELERAAAMRAWQEERILAEETRNAAAAAAEAEFGIPPEFSEEIFNIAEAWRDAQQAAEDFQNVMEVLRGGVPDLESAIAATGEAFRTAAEGIKLAKEEGQEEATVLTSAAGAMEELRGSAGELISVYDLGTEAGVAFSEASHAMADAALEEAAAMIASGQSAEDTTARMDELRTSLENQLVAWGVAQPLAEEYASTLLGTPEELTTVINNPGLIDALMNAEDLTVLYDDLGNPVIAEFEAMGIDTALADSEVFKDLVEEIAGMEAAPEITAEGAATATEDIEGTQGAVETLDAASADPEMKLSTQAAVVFLLLAELALVEQLDKESADPDMKVTTYNDFVSKMDTMQREVAALDLMVASPDVSVPAYAQVKSQLDTLQIEVAALDTMRASPSINLSGYYDTMAQIDAIQANIAATQSRTVTIHTAYTSSGVRPGLMAGGIVDEPGLYPLGERGYREAVVPLDLALSRVDPSVRELAAALRGQLGLTGSGKDGPRVQVNQVIQPISADPVDVSIQVVNRIAALME